MQFIVGTNRILYLNQTQGDKKYNLDPGSKRSLHYLRLTAEPRRPLLLESKQLSQKLALRNKGNPPVCDDKKENNMAFISFIVIKIKKKEFPFKMYCFKGEDTPDRQRYTNLLGFKTSRNHGPATRK